MNAIETKVEDKLKSDLKVAFEMMVAISGAIRDLKQVPSGTIYALVMGKLSLEAYEKILSMLTKAGLIRIDQSHLIHWIAA